MAEGEGICWREWLASRITTGRVIRGGFRWMAWGRGVRAVRRGVGGCHGSAIHTVALDEKCSQRATAAGKFTRIRRARLNGEG